MKRSAPVAFALVGLLALLSALAFVFLRDAGDTSKAGPQAALEDARRAAGERELSEPTAQTTALSEPEPLEASGSASSDQRQAAVTEDYDPARRIRVEGAVLLPRGTPADEALEVLVLRAEGAKSDQESPEPIVLQSGEVWSQGEILARTGVDPTGAFQVELEPTVEEARILLHGRYLFVREPSKVARSPEPTRVELEPELGAWISGRLRLPPGGEAAEIDRQELKLLLQPDERQVFVAGGAISAQREQERQAKLDPDLAFAWGGVTAGASYDLRVVPEAFAAVKTQRFEPKPGEHVTFDLALTRGARLSGSVLDAEGRAIPDAGLRLEIDPVMMGFGGFRVREGKSAADGRFELAAISPGKLILRARADGYLDLTDSIELSEGENRSGLALELARGNALAGRVSWPDGSPVVEVEVEAEFDASRLGGMEAFNAMSGPRGEAQTDAQGQFEITGLGKGPFTVKVKVEREEEDWRARINGVAPGTRDLELVLSPPVGIAGRVVDELGAPVTRFEVRARTRTTGMIRGLGAETVEDEFEDEQGRFRLSGLSAGAWELAAGAKGFGRTEEEFPLDIPLAADAPEIVLVLPHAASVAGVVLGPDGQAVAGAVVQVEVALADMASRGDGPGSPDAEPTDAQGRFTLDGLNPGSLSIYASSQGFARSDPVPLELGPSQRKEGVSLSLRIGGRILGEIFGKDGSPLSGATILAQNPSDLTGQRLAASDGEGRFTFENVRPGTWQVMSMPGGGGLQGGEAQDFSNLFSEMKLQMAEVKEGEDTFVQLGAPPADPVHAHGIVKLDGEPQAGVLVSFLPDGAGGGLSQFKMDSTDERGAYEIDLDRPGGYLVQVQKLTGGPGQQQNVQFNAEVPDERDHQLDLELPVGAISGLVRGPDGDPAGGVRVGLGVEGAVSNRSLFGGQYAEIATGPDGRYELVWLREGVYTVAAGGPTLGGLFGDSGGDEPGREVKSGVRVRAGERVEGVDFALQEPGSLTGVARAPAGNPIAGAAVFVRDEGGRLLELMSFVESDGSGRFRYGSLAPGRYSVLARDKSAVTPAEATVTIREGEESSVELTLVPGTILLVLLSDEGDNPVDCSLTVRDERGRQVNGTWSLSELMAISTSGSFSSKEQRIGPLPAGRYTVEATASDGKSAAKPVTLSGQAERKLNLRLKD